MRLYPLDFIRDIKSADKVVSLSFNFSGHTSDSLCKALDKDKAAVSRFVNSNSGLTFPALLNFIRATDNLLMLQWLALQFGYELRPINDKEEKRKRLLAELDALDAEVG